MPAAKTTSGPYGPSSSTTASTSDHVSNGRISSRRGSGFGTSLAGFSSITFQRTVAFSTCRSATIVAAFVSELAERFTIVEAVFDPWRAGQMAQEWEQRGIPAVASRSPIAA